MSSFKKLPDNFVGVGAEKIRREKQDAENCSTFSIAVVSMTATAVVLGGLYASGYFEKASDWLNQGSSKSSTMKNYKGDSIPQASKDKLNNLILKID